MPNVLHVTEGFWRAERSVVALAALPQRWGSFPRWQNIDEVQKANVQGFVGKSQRRRKRSTDRDTNTEREISWSRTENTSCSHTNQQPLGIIQYTPGGKSLKLYPLFIKHCSGTFFTLTRPHVHLVFAFEKHKV